jgi:hypothetical protein
LLGERVEDDMATRMILAAAIALATLRPSVSAAQQPPAPSPVTQPQPGTQPSQPILPPPATPTQSAAQPPAPTTPAVPQPIGTSGGETVPTPMAPACTPADVSNALPLLDRVSRLLDEALKDHLGKVDIDRATIDEMRAEIAQVRAAIQPVKR